MNIAEYKGPKGLQDTTFTLAAGGLKAFTGVGKLFQVVTSDGVLSIKTDKTTEATFQARQGVMADDSALFERVEITNRTGAPITARVIYGFGQFVDGQSQIIGSVEVTSSVLPAGAATAANQAALNAAVSTAANQALQIVQETASAASVASIDGKLTKTGASNNAWNATAVLAGGSSASLDTGNRSIVSGFGTSDAATTFTVQVSEDDVTYYDTLTTYVLAGAGEFHVTLTTAAKYVRLKSSGAATISATLVAKSQ